MTDSSGTPTGDRPAGLARRLAAGLRRVRAATDSRSRRVILLLVLLWILNGFDLYFTIMAGQLAHFNESNPIAVKMFSHPYALAAFKVGAVGFASMVMIMFRRRRTAEIACWCVCLVYVVVSFVWLSFFIRYEELMDRWPR
jgi:hypothetical protein